MNDLAQDLKAAKKVLEWYGRLSPAGREYVRAQLAELDKPELDLQFKGLVDEVQGHKQASSG